MKKDKKKDGFLAELRKIPIIQVACEKVGLSRTSVYRWKDEDSEFKKEMEEAMADGEAFVNDMSESQLLTLVKEKDWSAISFWLRHHHPAYKNKVEITTKYEDETLSPEQEELVRKALNLAGGQLETNTNDNEQNQSKQLPEESNGGSDNSTGISGGDGEGPKSENSGNQEKS